MDFLNQAIGQVRELMLSMTPAARVTALLLLGVIGVSLGYLVQQHSASPDDYLFNGEFLPPADADRAEAAIAKAGLEGYERVGNRIRVPRGRKAEYLAAVADDGALPPNFNTLLENALDLSPFTDRETRRQRYKAAREQQLSMIIRAMEGIEDAKVIYDVREPQGFSRNGEATATVSVQPTPGESIDPRRVKMIRKAVAGAIAGLKADDVTVANLSDGSMFGSGSEISPDMFDDPYFQRRVSWERLMKANIENLLQTIPGVNVQVTAELDKVIERKTRTTEPSGEAVAISESTQGDESETSQIDNRGRPGLTAQGPTRANDEVADVTIKDKKAITSSDTNNFIPTKEEVFLETGLTPEHVRVAIAIPSDYALSVWREEQRKQGNDPNQPLPNDIDTQLQQVKSGIETSVKATVVPLLPKELAENNFSDVIVTFFASITPDPVEPPSTASQLLTWAGQNFNTMTMAVIALVSLVMLRSMVKSVPPSEPAPAISAATLALDTVETSAAPTPTDETEIDESGRTKLKLNKGPTLKDDLTEIVREDPDAAAAILRNWIGNAG